MPALPIDSPRLLDFLVALLNTPSPTGFALDAVALAARWFEGLGVQGRYTRKGAWVGTLPGRAADTPRALTAHVDTLGVMVKEVKANGRLSLTKLGAYAWTSIEGEGCTVMTQRGERIRGSILLTKASAHIFGAEVNEMKRDDQALEVRLDARTTSRAETEALGVGVGDPIALDPRVETGPAGFVRSRHLDDKAAVACIWGALAALQQAGEAPAQRTTIHISHYEEVGHGGAHGVPDDVVELLAVDMAAVGPGQASDEFSACLCVKDSGGPYHDAMNRKLRGLAEAAGIPYRVDIYPYYSSDGTAFWRAGGDVRVGLVGPGVDASHSYERTHCDSLVHTAQLLAEYIRTA